MKGPHPENEALELAKRFFQLGRDIEAMKGRYQQARREMLERVEYFETVPAGMEKNQAFDRAYSLRRMIGILGDVMEEFPEGIFYQLPKLIESAKTYQDLEERLVKKIAKAEELFTRARQMMAPE